MTTPSTNSIVNKKEPFFTIEANGSRYNVTVIILNNKGEARIINQNSFQNVTFETTHTSPFLLGSLTLVNESNIDLLNSNHGTETNSYGHGDEFIKIKISYLNSKRKTITLLDKLFITTRKSNITQQNQKQTMYYFADIVYSHFYNKRVEWCTDMIADRSIPNYGQKKVNAGEALKHLLKFFSEDNNIIDDSDWDNGIGKLYYSLPSSTPALGGIKEILKSYVSSDESSGILTYYNGKFQLKSLKKHLTNVYKRQGNTNKIGNQLTGAFKIQTFDKQTKYTNKNIDLFGKKFDYIPLDINNIDFQDIQPDATLTTLAKNEVVQFSPEHKKFTIHSNHGTIKEVTNKTNVESLIGSKDNKINIDENSQFNVKTRIFNFSDEPTVEHYGTINLQKQLFNTLTTASFSTGGNINFNANKFIYMTIDLNLKNKFTQKIPGFWFIKNNLTKLSKQQFSSIIECVKLDKPA